MIKAEMDRNKETEPNFQFSCQLDSSIEINPNLLGNKAANLMEITRLGLPVPPGFVLTTKAWKAAREKDVLPFSVWSEVLSQLKILERKTGKKFGDSQNPLLVSVRSGSKYSMPGMMETILNIGINQKTAQGLAQRLGKECAQDSLVRTEEMFQRIIGQELPDDPLKQLKLAIKAVFSSWDNPQAQIYRQYNAIPENAGTAVVIQEMVFGNIPDGQSGTGVFFSRDPRTGEKKPTGEFVFFGQGEDVVQEKRKARKIPPELKEQLEKFADKLEKHFRAPLDIEFTVEQGRLYLLQSRELHGTSWAKIKTAIDFLKEGLISKQEALSKITPADIQTILKPSFEPQALKKARKKSLVGKGKPTAAGVAIGRVAFNPDEVAKLRKRGKRAILVCPRLDANDIRTFKSIEALVTTLGGTASHMALVLQRMGKAGIAGVKFRKKPKKGELVSVDGNSGEIFKGSLPLTKKPRLSPEITAFIQEWKAVFGESPWAAALYPTKEEYSRNAFLRKIEALRPQIEKWRSAKAQTTVLLNALIPAEFIIASQVFSPDNLEGIKRAALEIFKKEGFQPIPRSCYYPDELFSPWAVIDSPEKIDDFLHRPDFPGKYGGLPRWKKTPGLEAIIVPIEPVGKLDPRLASEHFSFTISCLSTQPARVIVDLRMKTPHLRIYDEILPEDLIQITAYLNPETRFYLGRIKVEIGENYQNDRYTKIVVETVKKKVFKNWWRPPFALPHLMAALDETYGLSVLEVQGRINQKGELLWCLVYGAKGREEKEKIKER